MLDSIPLIFERIALKENRARAVRVLLPSVAPGALTAGPMTALRFGQHLASELRSEFGVITISSGLGAAPRPWRRGELTERLGARKVSVRNVGRGQRATVSVHDLWIATHWRTAYALTVASKLGLIEPSRVIYVIQDYEPGFASWSSSYEAAKWTYHAGFVHVYNSIPLARFIGEREALEIDETLVLGPDLDLKRLRQVAARRREAEVREVFFYARREARNMLELGLAALARAASGTRRVWRAILAGQEIEPRPIAGLDVEWLGRTDYTGYFDLMTRTPVALSLMMSPHPSHPPLDWAASGGWVVTNAFEAWREGLHPRILTAAADPDSLGQLLARTIDSADAGEFLPPQLLGASLDAVTARVADLVT